MSRSWDQRQRKRFAIDGKECQKRRTGKKRQETGEQEREGECQRKGERKKENLCCLICSTTAEGSKHTKD